MEIITGTSEFQLNRPSAIAIGKFDGVHLGHRMLVDDIRSYAAEHDLQSVIFTFDPSPESFFTGHALPELTTTSEKRDIFEKLGIDVLIEFPMNQQTAATEPERFIRDYLVRQMHAEYIAAGSDLSYGSMGQGDSALLERLSGECGYSCHIVDKVTYEGVEISSTLIRNALKKGDMEYVTRLLGKPYAVSGTVSHGRKLGRTIGMPTANVIIPPDKLVGPKGVYFADVHSVMGDFHATVNIGVKPTVAEDELLCCESFLYGFEGNLYGTFIEVELLKFVRPEMKFSSVEELKTGMQNDIHAGAIFHHIAAE